MAVLERELTQPHDLVPQFAVGLDVIRLRIQQLQEFVKSYMVEGEDFGVIPGTQKPTLLKPGAEKLCDVYALTPQFDVTHRVEDWDKPLFHYEVRCTLVSRQSGIAIAQGVGSANIKESRYADRWVPQWKLQDLGITEVAGLQRREKKNDRGVYEYKVANSDPFTLLNTLLKMAKKRALVDAVLSATRSSGIFTQDVEDMDLGHMAATSQSGGNKQTGGRQTAAGGKISEAQVRFISRLQNTKVGAHEKVAAALESKGLDKVEDLSKNDASTLINQLQDLPDKEG